MKRIYKNNDIQFRIVSDTNVNRYRFYTLNKENYVQKLVSDVTSSNEIYLSWDEIKILEEGVLFCDYYCQEDNDKLLDGTFDNVRTFMSDFYLMTNIEYDNNDDTQPTTKYAEWGNIAGTITKQEDLVQYIDLKVKDASNNIDTSTLATKEDLNLKLDSTVYNQDKSTFATKTELQEYQVAGDYVTNEVLTQKGYLTSVDIANKADKSELPSLDGYLKEIPSEYVTDTELTQKGYLTSVDIANKADKSEIPSLDGYAKETWVNEQIDAKITSGSDIDLSSYAKKEDLNLKLDSSVYNQDKQTFALKSEIPNLEGYLTEIPQEYVTETELTDKGYLTEIPQEYVTDEKLLQKNYITNSDIANKADKSEIPSLDGYARETWVNEQIDAKLTGGTDVDLSSYATKEELNQKLDATVYNADKTELPEFGYDKTVSDTQVANNSILFKHDKLKNGDGALGWQGQLEDGTTADGFYIPGTNYFYSADLSNLKDGDEIFKFTINLSIGTFSKSLIFHPDRLEFTEQKDLQVITSRKNFYLAAYKSSIERTISSSESTDVFCTLAPEDDLKQFPFQIFFQPEDYLYGDYQTATVTSSNMVFKCDKEVQVDSKTKIDKLSNYIKFSDERKSYILTNDNIQNAVDLKTINNESLYGNGNIEINLTVDSTLNRSSENPLQNKVITEELEKKENCFNINGIYYAALQKTPISLNLFDNLKKEIKAGNQLYLFNYPYGSSSMYGEWEKWVSVYSKYNYRRTDYSQTISITLVKESKAYDVELMFIEVSYSDLVPKLTNKSYNFSSYALKSEIPSLDGYIKEIPSEYVTDSELQAKGYLIEHQDISNKVDKSELSNYVTNTALSQKGYLTEIPSNYVTNETLEGKNYATKSEIPSISNLATKEELNSKAEQSSVDLKADKTYVDGLIGGVETKITEINNLI